MTASDLLDAQRHDDERTDIGRKLSAVIHSK